MSTLIVPVRLVILIARSGFQLQPLCDVTSGRFEFTDQARRVRGPVMASPVTLFQLPGGSTSPGLESKERKYAVPFVAASFSLFVLGSGHRVHHAAARSGFLRSVGGPNLQAIYDPIPDPGLIVLMMTLFGLTFQFPGFWVSLELARIVTPAGLLRSWRWAIIIITVVSAVASTPSSDPWSMLALALPLVLFYFISIGIG